MGDLDRAERDLTEAAELHHDVSAAAGEAHSLERLAEVRLARGDREGARALLRRALPLARWSVISSHLIHRVYGTMIQAAPDPVAALAVVEQGDLAIGEQDRCDFCSLMFEVPAAIASPTPGWSTPPSGTWSWRNSPRRTPQQRLERLRRRGPRARRRTPPRRRGLRAIPRRGGGAVHRRRAAAGCRAVQAALVLRRDLGLSPAIPGALRSRRMIRLLIGAGIELLANALGLIVAAVVLDDLTITGAAFVVAVLIFTGVEVLVDPLLTRIALTSVPALRGGVAR